LFYRVKLTQGIGLMLDFQYWSRNDDSGEGVRTRIRGARAELEF
jgi:hypothetical protein